MLMFAFAGRGLDSAVLDTLPVQLDACMRAGCPAARETLDVASMLDTFIGFGPRDACRRASFAAWVCTTFGLDPSVGEAVAAVVVEWLQFAHLGRLTDATPSWWLLSWAVCPYAASIVHDLGSSPSDAGLVHWVERYNSDEDAFRDWVAAKVAEWGCGGVGMTLEVLMRVSHAAAEVLPWRDWYIGSGRDDAMDALARWLGAGGGWTEDAADWRRPAYYCHLRDVSPVPLRAVLGMEGRLGQRLPSDLRRVLLEIGDIGMAVFGDALMHAPVHQLPGVWEWTSRRTFNPESDTEPVEDVLGGSMLLGAGGGYYSSQLLLVTTGRHPGQVWVEVQDSGVECELVPIRESAWGGGSYLRVSGASDCVCALALACHAPRAGGGPRGHSGGGGSSVTSCKGVPFGAGAGAGSPST